MKRIWWLASYPKSGNTWIRAFLSAYHRGGEVNINAMTHSIGDLNTYWYQICSGKPVKDIELADFLMIRCAAMFNMSEAQHGDPLVVKTHNCNALIDRCQLQPPQLTSGAIYVVRDPRDVVISWSEHLAYSIEATIDKMADERFSITNGEGIPHIISSWSNNVRSWKNEKAYPVAIVRYEDMLEDAENAFRAILEFLKVDIDEDRLAAALAATRIGNLRTQEENDGFLEKRHQETFFNRGTAGHWRDILTDKQAALIERCHGEMMSELGYRLEFNDTKAA